MYRPLCCINYVKLNKRFPNSEASFPTLHPFNSDRVLKQSLHLRDKSIYVHLKFSIIQVLRWQIKRSRFFFCCCLFSGPFRIILCFQMCIIAEQRNLFSRYDRLEWFTACVSVFNFLRVSSHPLIYTLQLPHSTRPYPIQISSPSIPFPFFQ